MTVTKESYGLLQERYDKILKLLKEVDPEATPYASKNQAKQKLLDLQTVVKELIAKQEPAEQTLKLTGVLATILYQLGSVSIDTEEPSVGQKYLLECVDVIDTRRCEPEIILVSQLLFNQLGILFAENDPEKSLSYIVQAEDVYEKFKNSGHTPFETGDLLSANAEPDRDKSMRSLEKNYTLTLYYKAQIYGALKDALKSAVYCHITLQRQLENEDYDHIDWALNAATLSQFLMEKNGFKQARHHLAASRYILDEYERQLNESAPDYESKLEILRHRSADVARCWAKYGLLLLSVSKERLVNDESETVYSDLCKLDLGADSSVSADDLQSLSFRGVDLSAYEGEVSDQFALTAADARNVFVNIEKWLNKALEYYTLESLASDYVEIMQDKSQMYAKLAFFEENPENQSKLHKRRANLLESVVDAINPAYYIQFCRQIWFELAEIYSDMLDIKREKLLETSVRPTPHALAKINTLVDKSIENYRRFIDSFKNLATEKFPKSIPEDFESPFLRAHLHVAALSGRYVVLDKNMKLKRVRESLEAYKTVVDYCDGNPKAVELIRQEYGMCKEMVDLLPFKITKLQQEV